MNTNIVIIREKSLEDEYSIYNILDFTQEEVGNFLEINRDRLRYRAYYFTNIETTGDSEINDISYYIHVRYFYNYNSIAKKSEINYKSLCGISEQFIEKLILLFDKDDKITNDLDKNYKKYMAEAMIKNIIE